jgi:hypothetical protein
LTPEEIRAAAETHRELGPEYQSAVIDSFLDKVGREIDARVDQRMMMMGPMSRPVRPPKERAPMALAITSMAFGIPLTAITLGLGGHSVSGLVALIVVWIAITAINVSYSLGSHQQRPPYGHR